MTSQSEKVKILIYGYARQIQRDHKLCMDVPDDIILFIFACYPRMYLFGSWNEEKFKVSEDRISIKGRSDCSGYMVFADLGDENLYGINSDVHYWSMQLLMTQFYQENNEELQDCIEDNHWCFKSIGVTTFKPEGTVKCSVNAWLHGDENTYSYLNGIGPLHWDFGDTMTVKLDCNQWNVSYYKNGDKKPLKMDNIKENGYYYLAAAFCGHEDETYARIVDTPLALL